MLGHIVNFYQARLQKMKIYKKWHMGRFLLLQYAQLINVNFSKQIFGR